VTDSNNTKPGSDDFEPQMTPDDAAHYETLVDEWAETRRIAGLVMASSKTGLVTYFKEVGTADIADAIGGIGAYLEWRAIETEMLETAKLRLEVVLQQLQADGIPGLVNSEEAGFLN